MFLLVSRSRLIYLIPVDEVSVLDNAYLLGVDLANDTDAEARTREGLTEYQALRKAKLQAGFADLVLEQVS